jgi:hypothetical protein
MRRPRTVPAQRSLDELDGRNHPYGCELRQIDAPRGGSAGPHGRAGRGGAELEPHAALGLRDEEVRVAVAVDRSIRRSEVALFQLADVGAAAPK